MNPENAVAGGRFIKGGRSLLVGLIIQLGIFFIALLLSSAKVVGLAVKFAIESCDRSFLGVDIEIEKAALSVCKGYVNISNLVVLQPAEEIAYDRDEAGHIGEGRKTGKAITWNKDFIFKVRKLLVKINMWRLIKTLGQEFEVTDVNVTGICANVEKPTANIKKADSNMEYITNHLESLAQSWGLLGGEAGAADAVASQSNETPQHEAAAQPAAKPALPAAEENAGPRITVHRVMFGDVGCSVRASEVPVVGTLSFQLKVGTFQFEDITRDACDGREDLLPGEMIACLIKALAGHILKVVLKELPKRLVANAGARVKQGVGKCMPASCLPCGTT